MPKVWTPETPLAGQRFHADEDLIEEVHMGLQNLNVIFFGDGFSRSLRYDGTNCQLDLFTIQFHLIILKILKKIIMQFSKKHIQFKVRPKTNHLLASH